MDGDVRYVEEYILPTYLCALIAVIISGRIKIKSKDKDKRPKIDVFKVIENRFKNMNELRDLIDMDPRKGLVRIRDGAGFREVERGGCLHRNYLNLLEEELGAKLSIDLIERYIKR